MDHTATHRRDEVIHASRVATVEARLRHFGPAHRDEVILRSGHLPERYAEEHRRAVNALAAEAAEQEETALADAFAAPFLAERRRLQAEKPSIEALGELPGPETPAPSSSAAETTSAVASPPPGSADEPPSSDAAPAVASPRFVPSYLRTPPPAAPVIHVQPPIAQDHVDETLPPIRRAGPTLPFADAPPEAIAAAVRAASAAARSGAEPSPGDVDDEPRADGDETAFLPSSLFDGPATPFEKAPDISLEQYARFLGELAQDPSRAGVLRARFGIASEDAQRALGAGFAARFAEEPALRARFDALVAEARARRS